MARSSRGCGRPSCRCRRSPLARSGLRRLRILTCMPGKTSARPRPRSRSDRSRTIRAALERPTLRLPAGLHARGRHGPRGRLQIDLPPPRSTDLAAARRRQRQETEGQPHPGPRAGGLHLRQRFAQLLGWQVVMMLPLLPADRWHHREGARGIVGPIAGRYGPRHDARDPLPQPPSGRPHSFPPGIRLSSRGYRCLRARTIRDCPPTGSRLPSSARKLPWVERSVALVSFRLPS